MLCVVAGIYHFISIRKKEDKMAASNQVSVKNSTDDPFYKLLKLYNTANEKILKNNTSDIVPKFQVKVTGTLQGQICDMPILPTPPLVILVLEIFIGMYSLSILECLF